MTLDPTLPVIADDASAGDGLGEVVLGAGGLVDDTADVRSTVVRQWLDRRALERRLHDGAALRISALSLRLGLLRHAVMRGDHEFDAALEALQDELHLVLQELRDVEGRLYPPLLDEAGLGAALREAAARCPVPVRVDAPDERFGAAAEGAAYFALLDCLPQPGRCGDGPGPLGKAVDVAVRRDGDVLVLLVTGVDACHAGEVRDAVRLLGGTVAVSVAGPVGSTGESIGDLITVRIPCA